MDKQKLDEARQLAHSMISHPVAFGTIDHVERAGELLAELVKANEALAREAHTWWTAARDAPAAERARCALRVLIHSQYPIETDFDRGYDKARKDAAETLRTMGAEMSRPSTPVGWSDTDWLAHLERLQQNEAAYAKGPLPERGWD